MNRITSDEKKILKQFYDYCIDNGLEAGDEFNFKDIICKEETHIPLRIKDTLNDLLNIQYIVIIVDDAWFTQEGWNFCIKTF